MARVITFVTGLLLEYPGARLIPALVAVEFPYVQVQNLNIILLTAPELVQLRKGLKELKTDDSISLFLALYRSWCHSPVATFSLCLLAQVYDHACDLLSKFAEMEVRLSRFTAARVGWTGQLTRAMSALCPTLWPR